MAKATAKPTAADEALALAGQMQFVRAALDPEGDWEEEDLDDLARYRMGELREAERAADACERLLDVVDEIEHHYRNRGLNEIRGAGGEHALFGELWRAAALARAAL
jgi:hypothetical protein